MQLSETMEYSLRKVEHLEQNVTSFPHITKNGKWLTHKDAHWTGGFWTGLLWINSLNSKKNVDQEIALKWAKKFKTRITDNKTHDQGFIYGPSCIFGYNITGDKELRDYALAGANNLIDLYEERAGLVLAWDEPGYEGNAIVDTIMNVPILIWASKISNKPELTDLACKIADSININHVKGDGSVYHMVKWDEASFNIVERTTHQGYSSETCWSRGQAWALYGFAQMHRYSNKKHYLVTSEKLANYFWEHLDDWWYLPRWDFEFKNNENEPFDSAAASIAASGMLLLSQQLLNDDQVESAKIWLDRGSMIVKSLSEHCLYTSIDEYGIIEKATVDKPRESGINESTMYGDYYYVESLFRLTNRNNPEKLNLLY
jgi:unsaturated chondroitin disaccharide hydrolase